MITVRKDNVVRVVEESAEAEWLSRGFAVVDRGELEDEPEDEPEDELEDEPEQVVLPPPEIEDTSESGKLMYGEVYVSQLGTKAQLRDFLESVGIATKERQSNAELKALADAHIEQIKKNRSCNNG